MSTAHTLSHQLKLDSPYCGDPNCVYCKELRAAHELINEGTQFRLSSAQRPKKPFRAVKQNSP